MESYFRPAGHVANVVEVPDCDRGDFNDPTKPLLDGWLDAVDRKDKYDLIVLDNGAATGGLEEEN